MGRSSDAAAILQRLRSRGASPVHEAHVLLGLKRYDEALERLRKAVDLRAAQVTAFGVAPQYDELREMPAFKELEERGFVVLPRVVAPREQERLTTAYTEAVTSATGDDIRVGSTSTKVSDFEIVARPSTTCTYCRRCSRPAARSSVALQAELVPRENAAAWRARTGTPRGRSTELGRLAAARLHPDGG
jgi:hypothetical protein